MSVIALTIVFMVVIVLLFIVTITSNRIWYNKLIAQNRVWSDLCRRNNKDWIEASTKIIERINELESQVEALKNGDVKE